MLRKGIVALMISFMSVSTGVTDAGDIVKPPVKPNPIYEFLRGPLVGRPRHSREATRPTRPASTTVEHAVVQDAASQVPDIRQTSSNNRTTLQPADRAPQPLPQKFNDSPSRQTMLIPAPAGGVLSTPAPGNTSQVSASHTAPRPVPQNANRSTTRAVGRDVAMSIRNSAPIHLVSSGPVKRHRNNNIAAAAPPAPSGPGAMYPAPKPGIPHQMGGTAVVNQAFHPHEMLYPHSYRAMYGPYYYKVHGGWVVTPFGVWSKENWKLKGTMVNVKYKSHISPFTLFKPPVIR